MTSTPLVSIIIPTFNRRELVAETLDSILCQTYGNFEVIVVSDHSADGTLGLSATYTDPRCRFFQLPAKSNGPARVRNFGIGKSTGELIAFCDDDDLWLPEKLDKQVSYLNHNRDVMLLGTNVTYFGPSKREHRSFGRLKNFLNALPIDPKYLIAFYNCVVMSSAILRREILAEVGNFDESDNHQGHEDIDLWIRISLAGKVRILREELTKYRVHIRQLTTAASQHYKLSSLGVSEKYLSRFTVPQRLLFTARMAVYRLTGK